MESHQLYVSTILLSFLASSCYGHWDGAYMRNAEDGFSRRNNWMTYIRDDVPLRQLAIPGTHDSGTFKLDLASFSDISKTQILSFDEQLNYGVRFFDIRIRHISNAFALHHDLIYLHLNFDDFLTSVTGFLNSNPSETVLFRLKEDYTPSDNSRSLTDTLQDYMNRYTNRYLRTFDTSITLGNARGKFIILSDNSQFNSFGLIYNSLNIQDNFHLTTNWDLYNKWESIKWQLENARNGDTGTFYLNYLSGSGGSFPYFVASGHTSQGTSASRLATGLTTPGWQNSYPDFPRVNCFFWICTIAFEGTNILTRDKINQYNQSSGRRTVGIIIADFPGDSLLGTIIENNRYLRK